MNGRASVGIKIVRINKLDGQIVITKIIYELLIFLLLQQTKYTARKIRQYKEKNLGEKSSNQCEKLFIH